jgi:hypothetical protein
MRTRVQHTLQSMALANGLRRGTAHHSRRGRARFAVPGASGHAHPRAYADSVEAEGSLSSKGLLGRRPPAVLRPARPQPGVHRPERRTRRPRHLAHNAHPVLERWRFSAPSATLGQPEAPRHQCARDGLDRGAACCAPACQRVNPAPRLKSLCENSRIFVGRGFSHDINTAKPARLQPLKS